MGKQHWKPGNLLNPLPVVMVSCCRPGEKPNIITAAWTGTICSDPVLVSVSVRKERWSHDIIRDTGEFVINLTSPELVRAADYCGVKSGREIDKYEECHLTRLPSEHIAAPGIAESPLNLECKVRQVLELGSHDMFIAEVLGVTVDECCLNAKGKLEINPRLVAYSHGEYRLLGEKLGSFGYSVKKK